MKRLPLNNKLAALLLAACCLAVILPGCSKTKRDPVAESWKRLQEKSLGHTPTETQPREYLEETIEEVEVIGEDTKTVEIPLPSTPVVMNSPSIDVHTALRALARAANQSIIISQNVTGQTTAVFNGEPWSDAFRSILSSAGLIYTREGNIIKVLALEDLEHELQLIELKQKRQDMENAIRKGSGLLTAVLKVKYAKSDALRENMLSFLSKDSEGESIGSVTLDTHTNSLVVQAIKPDLTRIMKLVRRIDRPSPQIRLRAHIVETTTETARALGIQWAGNYARNPVGGNSSDSLFIMPGGSGTYDATTNTLTTTSDLGNGFTGTGTGINFPPVDFPVDGQGAQFGLAFGTLGANILEVQLSALEQDDKLNILSSPSLTTLDNQTAYTENGEKVPFVTINEDGQSEVAFENAVLRLEMTPHVIDDLHLKMEIAVTKDEVDTSRTVEGNPFIIKKKTETTLITRDEETIVISGLSKNTRSVGETGLPGLKNVPLLGWLFKSEEKSNKLEEVLIFITPTILPQWQPGEKQKTREELEEEIRQEIKAEQEGGDEPEPEDGD